MVTNPFPEKQFEYVCVYNNDDDMVFSVAYLLYLTTISVLFPEHILVFSFSLQVATPTDLQGNLGANTISEFLTPAQGYLYEAVLTFLLVFIIHGVSDPLRKDIKGSAPLAIGLAVAACHLSGVSW